MDIYYSFMSLCIFEEIVFLVGHILTLGKTGFALVRKYHLAVDGQLAMSVSVKKWSNGLEFGLL